MRRRSTRALAVMRVVCLASAAFLGALLSGCDPIYVRDLSVSATSVPHQPLDRVLRPIATQYKLVESANTSSRFERRWPSSADGHRSQVSLSIRTESTPNLWHVTIAEWFGIRQSQFGAELQSAVTTACEANGYKVSAGR